jgi:hypothetical protein
MLVVDVSGEADKDLEMEALAMMKREWPATSAASLGRDGPPITGIMCGHQALFKNHVGRTCERRRVH